MSRIRVLNVAEKPSVAREVATCLSNNTTRRVSGGYVTEFVCNVLVKSLPLNLKHSQVEKLQRPCLEPPV